jgi:Xaa-Pro dipeptidase
MTQELYAGHVREMQQRWEAALLAEDYSAILMHAGSPLISFLDDYVYPFRSNPHFLAWLPLTHHPDSVLLIRPGERPLLWFYQPEDYWHSPPQDPAAWWADHIEVRVVSECGVWRSEVPTSRNSIAVLGDSPELAGEFAPGQINPGNLLARLHLERTRKTPYEQASMQRANHAAAQAHVAAEQAFRAGKSEFDIHLAYLGKCRQNDVELPYGSIVALNHHGAVLHYQRRDRAAPDESRSFLIDAGATCAAYAADITRTYARDAGEFADLVAAMDAMQQELAGSVSAGQDFKALHLATHLRIAGILAAAGIITVSAEEAVETGLSSVFFPHGLGHFIGLQTHDVAGLVDNRGQAIARPAGHPYLRLTRELEPGNVVTIEPGLYFVESLLENWKATRNPRAINWDAVDHLAPYGGIRIEDNVVVTEKANVNLTRTAFADL